MTCYQSDTGLGRSMCERMLRQSQSVVLFYSLFYQLSDRKSINDYRKMLIIGPDYQLGPMITLHPQLSQPDLKIDKYHTLIEGQLVFVIYACRRDVTMTSP